MPKPRKATAKPQPALSNQSQDTDDELEDLPDFVIEKDNRAIFNESEEEPEPAEHKRRSMPRPEVLEEFKNSIMPDKFSADDHRKKRDAKQERKKNKFEREKSKLGSLTVHTHRGWLLPREAFNIYEKNADSL